MIALPLAQPPAVDMAQTIADPAERRAAAQCAPTLKHKAGGEISTIDVAGFHRTGPSATLNGTIRILQKPPTRPGEMTPTHVVVMLYSYQCRLNGHGVPRIKLKPLGD